MSETSGEQVLSKCKEIHAAFNSLDQKTFRRVWIAAARNCMQRYQCDKYLQALNTAEKFLENQIDESELKMAYESLYHIKYLNNLNVCTCANDEYCHFLLYNLGWTSLIPFEYMHILPNYPKFKLSIKIAYDDIKSELEKLKGESHSVQKA